MPLSRLGPSPSSLNGPELLPAVYVVEHLLGHGHHVLVELLAGADPVAQSVGAQRDGLRGSVACESKTKRALQHNVMPWESFGSSKKSLALKKM